MRLPVLMLIVLYLLALAIDYYIYRDILYGEKDHKRKLFPYRMRWYSAPWLWIYFSIACYALLTVAICLPKREGSSLHPILWMLFIFLTIYASKIGYIIGSAIGYLLRIWRRRRLDTRQWLGLPLAFLFLFTFVWGTFVGRHHIEIKEVTVQSRNLPASFNGYRIVQFSDAHVDSWGNDTTFVSKLVDCINSLNPDLIVFTGDIVSRNTKELHPFVNVLSRLKANDGVYSVLGNHDYGDYYNWSSEKEKEANLAELISLEKQMGWKLLNNANDTIRRGNDFIVIAGVENWGEPPFKQYGDLSKALPAKPSNKDTFILLLSHNPMHWHNTVRYNSDIDLTLSGHTHAMQCEFSIGNWRWSPSQWRYPEWSGLYSSKPTPETLSQLYVNVGSGSVGMPARLGTSFPEVTVITLKPTCN